MLMGLKTKKKENVFLKYYNNNTQFIAVLRYLNKEMNKNNFEKYIYAKKQLK